MVFNNVHTTKKMAAVLLALVFMTGTAFASPQPPKIKDHPEQEQQEQQDQQNQKKHQEQEQKKIQEQKKHQEQQQKNYQNQQNQQNYQNQTYYQNQPNIHNQPNRHNQDYVEKLPVHFVRSQAGDIEINRIRYNQGGNIELLLGYKNYPGNYYVDDIRWNKNQRIIVRDTYGRYYYARVVRSDRNIIELIVDGLQGGQNYFIEIPGITSNNNGYNVKGNFWAKDKWRFKR